MERLTRASRTHRCDVCNGSKGCSELPESAGWICIRVSSDRTTRNGAWLHLSDPGDRRGRQRRREQSVIIPSRLPSRAGLALLAEGYRTAASPEAVERQAARLGLTVDSLRRLRFGWAYDGGRPDDADAGDVVRSSGCRVWSYPMLDIDGHVLNVRYRNDLGRKWGVRGGKEGLFIPDGLPDTGPLVVCEGPTDTGAALDWGFAAVGRPSASGGARLVLELVRRQRRAEAVVFSDVDGHGAGQRGAEALALLLLPYCRSVRVIRPPPGVKDARDWKRAGGATEDVMQAIQAAPVRRLGVRRAS